MRVIAGKFKGKKLLPPKSEFIRPTGDKVKQAIFTKLQFFVEGKRVLDLFSGSGALGIEALSRGAREVIFVDHSREGVNLTKTNLKNVGKLCEVIFSLFDKALEKFKGKFDLILLDPPYKSGYYEQCLETIYKRQLLSDDGVIVCERDRTLPFNVDYFEMFDSKNYGTVSVDYYKNKEKL